MAQIKRYVCLRLRDKNDVSPQPMGDTDLVEDIWIAPSAVACDHGRPIDQRNNVLDYCWILPDVIRSPTTKTNGLSSAF
jgi:hypothetical protein